MNRQGKIWGSTSLLFNKNNVEVHRIEGLKGGHCSEHCHQHKYNMFFVEKGKIEIDIEKGYGLIDKTVLGPMESCVVDPGEYHRFKVLQEDTVALEIYWVELETNDIDRKDHGGLSGI